MNDIILAGILLLVSSPFAYLILRLIFGKSIMLTFSLWSVGLVYLCCEIYYIVGKYGILNMIWGLPVAFAFGTSIFLYLNSKLKKPLKNATEQLKTVSTGDVSFHIEKDIINSKNELGALNESIIQLKENLNKIFFEVSANSENLYLIGQQLATNSQTLSHRNTEQASSVEEISTTLEEFSSNIEQNMQNAHQTELISAKALQGMAEISERTQRTVDANNIIAGKIKIINDIAFQTNILALNAAVEAARAGEHGKGFAVVAAEVRKLAEKSKQSADEIVSLAQDSFKYAFEAKEKISEILPEIEKTTILVKGISHASTQQNSGTTEINNAMLQINRLTQDNTSSSEELASSADELVNKAEVLKESVSYFKLDRQ